MSDSSGPKKDTVRITLPPRPSPHPSGPGSEGRDSIRINLPSKPPGNGSAAPLAPIRRTTPPPPPPSKRPPPPPAAVASSAPPAPLVSFLPPPPLAPAAAVIQPLRPLPPVIAETMSRPQLEAAPPAPPPMPPRPRILPPPPRVLPPSAAASAVTPAPGTYPGSGTHAGPLKETARITILPERAVPPATVKMAKTQPLLAVPAAKRAAPIIVPAKNDAAPPQDWSAMLEAVPLPICWTLFGISAVTLLIQIWNYVAS